VAGGCSQQFRSGAFALLSRKTIEKRLAVPFPAERHVMPDTGHFQIERAFRFMGFVSPAENHLLTVQYDLRAKVMHPIAAKQLYSITSAACICLIAETKRVLHLSNKLRGK
jgi:hypothetical protein